MLPAITYKRILALLLVALVAITVLAYIVTTQRLADAQRARREDDLVRAEELLASVWLLPGLGKSVALEQQLMAVQQGDLREEKSLHSQTLGGTKQRGLILEALAKGNLASFQWEQARKHAEAILSRQPDAAYALWLRGRARMEMQLEVKAREDLEAALRAEPGSFAIRYSLANLLHKLGYVDVAIEHYRALVAKRPNDERLLLALAHGHQEQARNDEAIRIVENLLAARPRSVEAHIEGARLALRANQPEEAERKLRHAIQLRADDGEANFLLRLALQAQKKSDPDVERHIHENAMRQAELKTLLSMRRNRPEVLTDVGLWMMSTGVDDEVLGWLYAALKEDANYKPAHAGLAQYFHEHGQFRRAAWHAKLADKDPPLAHVGESLRDSQTAAHVGESLRDSQTAAHVGKSLRDSQTAAHVGKSLRDSQTTAHVGKSLRDSQTAAHVGKSLRDSQTAAHVGKSLRDSQTAAHVGESLRDSQTDSSITSANSEATQTEVHRLCATCHAYPAPESMPRATWRKEVKQGYDFLRRSNVAGDFPSLESVVAYYERRAPERLPPIEQSVSSSQSPVKFETRGTGYMPRLPPSPGVTNANLASLLGNKTQELLLCETSQDALMILKPYDTAPGGIIIPQVSSPCHTTVCDLDLDGHQDILVASIGSFFPTDDKVGKVMWLKGKSGGQFDAVPLQEGVGRVTDIQIADFNGDQHLDLIVAVYGWRSTGEILYLANHTLDWSQPKFVRQVVDARHGAIHLSVADIDRNGRPDFVGLVSQEHEAVVAYLNQGDDRFEPTTLYAAPHPSYGSSGMELVDLDGDLDLDVLLSNGDILDPPYLLKPYHGVQWLENTGTFPFKHHSIAAMYGAMRAVAADFDGDGDRDVAAVSFLPSLHFPEREKLQIPSVVLFEQKPGTQFEMHVLETGTCDHFSCVAGDWDGDGRVDLAVTNFSWNGSQPMRNAATLWRNVGK